MSGSDLKSDAILELARRYHYNAQHAHQVECLAGTLFMELQPLHRLGAEERKLLEFAAVLHDIGYFVTSRGHHRHALQMIMLEPLTPFTRQEKGIIANVARYHRKVLPTIEHTAYAILTIDDRVKVNLLASILRLADALDRSHQSLVTELSCDIRHDHIMIHITATGDMVEEKLALSRKADMFQEIFQREVQLNIRCTDTPKTEISPVMV